MQLRSMAPMDDETTFRDFFERAAVGIHFVGADGTILYANQTALDLLGYRRDEYIGRPMSDFHVDAHVIEDILARLRRGETLHDYEARLRARDGSVRYVLITSNARRGPGGEFLHSRCVTRDITELKRADAERQATQARFELLARMAPVGLFRTDAAGDCIYVNQRWCEITGLTPEQARGSGWAATLHPEDRARVFDEWYRAATTGTEFHAEYRFVHPDGTVRWVVGRGLPERAGEALVGYIGAVADVTDRKEGELEREHVLAQEQEARAEAERLNRAKGEFLEQRSRLAAIVDNADDAIVSKTLTGIIRSWNRAAERLFGWTAEEAVGRHITMIIPEERRSEEDDILARIRRGEMVDHFETIRMRKDGRRLHVSLTISPVKDAEGRIIGASKIARDITERRRMEEERERLLAREREAREEAEAANRTKEQLLAIVSHELRTPLNSILGYARMLQTGDLDVEARPHAVDVIVRSASAQARLVEDLLDLSRIVSGRLAFSLEECEAAALIADALDAVRPAADTKTIRLVSDVAPDLGRIVCDPDRLRQVVWNVVMNAIKFTSVGGRVDVTARRRGSELHVAVADNGVGISAEALPHVFEPFRQEDSSTTRHQGGLGLGLALVKQIVELHGGRVTASSPGKGQGSTFEVWIPVVARRVTQPERSVLSGTS